MDETLKIIGEKGIKNLRESMAGEDRDATGKTSASFRFEIEGKKVKFIGPEHVSLLVNGRNPTHSKEEWGGNKGAGGAPLGPLIEWLEARMLPISEWAIKYKVDTEGFEGTPDLILSPKNRTLAFAKIRVNNLATGMVHDLKEQAFQYLKKKQ